MKAELPDPEGGETLTIEVADTVFRFLKGASACPHSQIIVDRDLATIKCESCNAVMNPVEWIAKLAESWHRVKYQREQMDEARRRLEWKELTKCRHCGKMTKIRPKQGRLPAEARPE